MAAKHPRNSDETWREKVTGNRDAYESRVIERFRKALIEAHPEWPMETCAEAAHVCARAQAAACFTVPT